MRAVWGRVGAIGRGAFTLGAGYACQQCLPCSPVHRTVSSAASKCKPQRRLW